MTCPDDATLVELVGGHLDAAAVSGLDAHLDGCDECRQVVAALSGGAELGRGMQLGRYLIVDVLGSGAMGLVYEAYDPTLHRRVAIKVLRPEAEVPRDRLVREARALARLAHPNVVTVYEVGEAGEAVFVAMELVEGESLRAWMRARSRSWSEVREVFAQAAAGLDAAHAAALVHRDVKPDNIIVGADGRVRVTDFGLARTGETHEAAALEGDVALEQTISRTGAVLGTPAYMAPEQLRGGEADARSDQFGLCVALFEALYGTRPFAGEDLPALRRSVLAGEVRPVPRDARVPRWLDAAVRRGLACDPAQRFGSLAALEHELRRERRGVQRWLLGGAAAAVVAASLGFALLRGGGAAAPPPDPCAGSEPAFAAVWSPERRAAVGARLEAAADPYARGLAPVVATGVEAWGRSWIAGHREACLATRVRGEQSEAALDGRMRCLREHLRQLDVLAGAIEAGEPGALAGAAEAVAALPEVGDCADVDALSSVAPPPRGRDAELEAIAADTARARLALSTGELATGARLAAAVVERAIAIGYLPVVAEARLVHAELLRALGDAGRAARVADEALLAATEARDDQRVARAWLALAIIEGSRGALEPAVRHARHARAAAARVAAGPALRAALHNTTGALLLEQGELDEARVELERALALRLEHGGEAQGATAAVLTNLGHLARLSGRLDEAAALHRRAMAAELAVLGAGHAREAIHLHNLAGVLRLQQDYAGARVAYERALAIKRARLGDEHPDVALTENSLGVLAETEGDRSRARAHYELAVRLFEAAGDARAEVSRRNLARVRPPARARPPAAPPLQPASPPPVGSYMSGSGWDSP